MISRKKLQAFYLAKPEPHRNASFEAWFKLTRRARWHSFQDVKAFFGQSHVARDTKSGRTATIFDIGGNKYRLIALIDYTRQTLLITHALDHNNYDKGRWKSEI